jgi:fluoroacetyl-CoA thioesterase
MSTSTEPQPNAISTASLVVAETDLASCLSLSPDDHFPAVFATARMIALMEVAASRTLIPFLGPGQLSVGVSVDATHSAPTPLGERVEAEARYVGRTGTGGNLFEFEIVARDEGGEIGRTRHVRAIVDTERLQVRAVRRIGAVKGEL